MYQSKLLYTALFQCAGNMKKVLMHTEIILPSFMIKSHLIKLAALFVCIDSENKHLKNHGQILN